MPPKSAPMTQAAILRMIKESVDAVIAVEQARQANVRNNASGFGLVRGRDTAPNFEKTESVFEISECAEGKKVKFVAATLEGPALTWWKTKVATIGLETMNQMPWTEMKQLMTAEFCPIEEIQRIEHELWNLRVKEYDIVAYTQRFNELALMCLRMVKPERVKVDAYIRGLTDNIKESVDAAIATERARQANVRNDASRSGPVRGRDTAPAVCECTFARFMKYNPAAFHGVEGAVELRRWFKKTESVFKISECAEGKKVKFAAATLEGPALTWWKTKVIQRMEHELWNLRVKEYDIVTYTQRFNKIALMCPRMVEPERLKIDAYIRGLTDNIKGEVTSSKPANLNKAIRMAHKLMEQKSQARNERILEGNARAMITAPTDGKLPLCERCFTRDVGQYTIKCHKCGKVEHKARYCKEKSVATGANAQPI
ncbi:putative reverse transcriptase domain-containing protein [Tanacetum coccineum]